MPVRSVIHHAVLPFCRAVVHHGGAGTTAAGFRAGVPTDPVGYRRSANVGGR